MKYDPSSTPDPARWLALPEGERIAAVAKYHRSAGISVEGGVEIHAAFHAAVENQLALPDQDHVRDALARLMGEGLTRHDAVHAIGTVLSGLMFDLMKYGTPFSEGQYRKELSELTAQSWREA
jgi:hypothetical protein